MRMLVIGAVPCSLAACVDTPEPEQPAPKQLHSGLDPAHVVAAVEAVSHHCARRRGWG